MRQSDPPRVWLLAPDGLQWRCSILAAANDFELRMGPVLVSEQLGGDVDWHAVSDDLGGDEPAKSWEGEANGVAVVEPQVSPGGGLVEVRAGRRDVDDAAAAVGPLLLEPERHRRAEGLLLGGEPSQQGQGPVGLGDALETPPEDVRQLGADRQDSFHVGPGGTRSSGRISPFGLRNGWIDRWFSQSISWLRRPVCRRTCRHAQVQDAWCSTRLRLTRCPSGSIPLHRHRGVPGREQAADRTSS